MEEAAEAEPLPHGLPRMCATSSPSNSRAPSNHMLPKHGAGVSPLWENSRHGSDLVPGRHLFCPLTLCLLHPQMVWGWTTLVPAARGGGEQNQDWRVFQG